MNHQSAAPKISPRVKTATANRPKRLLRLMGTINRITLDNKPRVVAALNFHGRSKMGWGTRSGGAGFLE